MEEEEEEEEEEEANLLEIRPDVGHGGAGGMNVEKAGNDADDLRQFPVDLGGARVRRRRRTLIGREEKERL